MDVLVSIKKKTIILGCILTLIVFLITHKLELCLGIIIGCILSILNFKMIEFTASKAVKFSGKKQAIIYVLTNYLLKLPILILILAIIINISFWLFLGMLTGLIMINMVIYYHSIRLKTLLDK
jgi:hypothetical protein